MAVKITGIEENSIAKKFNIHPEDILLSINNNEIIDILDYRFHEVNCKLNLKLSRNSKIINIRIKKDEYEPIGLEFDSYLMDEQKHCKNNCIFCFIDQLPKGLRETLYFKDDDSRLSFLFGNYITLTNLTEHEINRIIKMHISPINISVHTTNPALRCKMMNNKFAGESLKTIERLAQAEININCQIVLCPGINDKEELENTLNDLKKLSSAVQSIAVVPVGLTKFRDNLPKLRCFTKQEAKETIDLIQKFGDNCKSELGTRLAYPADEFFIKANLKIPSVDFYEDFNQIENGVGMLALFEDEFKVALEQFPAKNYNKHLSVATAVAAYPFILKLTKLAQERYNIKIDVYKIENDFFGRNITVSGLITGEDLIKNLKDKDLGSKLLIPANMLRKEKDMFLDNITLKQLEDALKTKVQVVDVDGYEFLLNILDEN